MPKFTPFWNLAPDINKPDVLNMYVYGEIKSSSHWLFGSDTDVVTSSFIKDLNRYPDVNTINVYINSPGGDVFAAAAIKNQLKAHKAQVHTWGDGLIASAAVGLMCAADQGCRHMSKAALLMIHDPMTRVQGNVRDMEKAIEVLNKVKNTIVNIYEEATGLERTKLEEMMAAETYLEASEAKEYGFIDVITEDEAEMTITNDDTFTFNGVSCTFSNFANPKALREKLQHLANVTNNHEGGTLMNFEDILASLPADQQSTVRNHIATVITNAVTEKQTTWNTEKTQLTNDLANAQAELLTAQNDLAAANEKLQGINSTQNPEDAFLDSLPADAKQMVLQARAAQAAAEAKLQEAEEAKNYEAFKNTLSVYDSLPIQEEQYKALYALNKADSKNYEALVGLMEVANEAMAAGFTAKGSDQGVPAVTNAWEAIEQKVTALRAEDNTLSYNEALNRVVKENPELYDRYRNNL